MSPARTPETAAQQLRRLLEVIPRIADGQRHELDDIERKEGIDAALLLKDLRSLAGRESEPAGFVEGVQIYLGNGRVQLVTSHFHRPMRITRSELAALELGLAMIRCERKPAERPAIDRARARLQAALAKLPSDERDAEAEARIDRHADAGAAADPALLSSLRTALKGRRTTRIAYRKGASTVAESREVRPYALVAARGAWYLVAHCERNTDVRFFRLDRMEAAEPLEGRYEIPESFKVEQWVRDGAAFRAAHPAVLRIRYSPRVARWIAEREGKPLDADGSLTMEHPLADESWGVRHALQYGPDAEVLEPTSVREEIARRMSAIAGLSATMESR
jgi:proteasome accessory factor C